jgi:hypothetical protein
MGAAIKMNWEQEYRERVNECAEQGMALARELADAGTLEPLYLYARPSKPGEPGRLFLVNDSASTVPHGSSLVTGEGLRANVPLDSYFTWVYERAKRAPILSI